MNIEKKIKRTKSEARTSRPGRLTSNPVVPGRPNYLYVDFLDGSPPAACWNPSLPPAPGLHVLVQVRDGRRAILADRAVFAEDYTFSFTKFHRDNHLWYGPDPTLVDLRQILWLQPTVSGLVLTVRPGWLLTTSGWVYFEGDTVDLSPLRPATGARFALATIDSDGELTITNGGIVADMFALGKGDIPALPAGHRLICASRLYSGQTVIRDTQFATDLLDLRFATLGKGAESGVWGEIAGNISLQADLQNLLVNKQPLSDALTQISGLTPDEGDIMTFDGSEWVASPVPHSGIPEAPIDGKQYTRKNGGWNEIIPGSGEGDMLKSVYDTNDDGVVNGADEVDGVATAGNSKYYGTNASGTPGFHSLPSGGGGAVVKIDEQLLNDATAEIEFDVPDTYTHLEIRLQGRGSANATEMEVRAVINDDTGSNYDYQVDVIYASNRLAFSRISESSIWVGTITAVNSPANAAGQINMKINNYNGVFHKNIMSDIIVRVGTGEQDFRLMKMGGFWKSTSAITKIKLYLAVGNFVAGTFVSLYGIE